MIETLTKMETGKWVPLKNTKHQREKKEIKLKQMQKQISSNLITDFRRETYSNGQIKRDLSNCLKKEKGPKLDDNRYLKKRPRHLF